MKKITGFVDAFLFCFIFSFVCFINQCTEAAPIILMHRQKKEDKRRNNKEKKPEEWGEGRMDGKEKKRDRNGDNGVQK